MRCTPFHLSSRRRFLSQLAWGTVAGSYASYVAPGAFAEQLQRTPAQTEGPFYPDKLPLDTDNDLLIINDQLSPAVGTVAYVSGRVLSEHGEPIRDAVVEIWQADNHGAYLHSRSMNGDQRDGNFQGFGRFLTGSRGEYLFRTIRPVPYPGRTPHIHFAVNRRGERLLTTQLYVEGETRNAQDGIYRSLGREGQALVTRPFQAFEGAQAGELSAEFDLIVGLTPENA